MTRREYVNFDTLAEKLRASYAEATIDFVAATVFCEYGNSSSEEEFIEITETLLDKFWTAREITIVRNELGSPSTYKFEKDEFTNSFVTWREKTEKFVRELIDKKIRFSKLTDNGFESKNGYIVKAVK